MHGAMIFRMKGKCTLLETALSGLEIKNLILDPLSSKLETRSPRRETQSLKVLRIKNQVSCLEDRDAIDCQLTFERYFSS